jgi:putative addiction module component (TIGR02574 family)
MTPKAIRDEILKLPAAERLELLDELWDSLAADASTVPVPEWHKRELDRRVAEPSPKHITSEELHSRLKRLE